MPTSIEQRIAGLSPEQRARFESRLQQIGAPREVQRIPRRDPAQPCPLSYSQQRIWVPGQLHPGLTAYNDCSVIRFAGELDADVLRASLQEIMRRHEALRTTFSISAGTPVQVIHAPGNMAGRMELPISDFSSLPEAAWGAAIQSNALAEAQHPYDSSRDFPWRARLLRFNSQEHVLVIRQHHIANDGWSASIFWRELTALYEASADERRSGLPDLPIQYADYAAWQRQWVRGDAARAQLEYWTRQLADAPLLLDLPADRPRPAIPTFCGARHTFVLSPSTTRSLKEWTEARKATLFMGLLAGLKILLHRYTGQSDLVIGSPIAARTHPEIEGLIGFFLNNLALRTQLSGEVTANEVLARVRETTLNAYARQEIPFEAVLEALHPERSLSYAPLLQVMLNLLNTPPQKYRLGNLAVERIPIDRGISRLDLLISLTESAGGLEGYVEYNSDLFDRATIEQMIGHYQILLQAIVDQPEERIAGLPLLSGAEQQQILVAWNQTDSDFGEQPGLVCQFERQAERTPGAVAFICGDEHLTFQELNHRANRLARLLSSRGVKPGVVVGLCLERSLEFVTSLIAIFKAGGVYLPLAPSLPGSRLSFIITDAVPGVIVTRSALRASVESSVESGGPTIICLDDLTESLQRTASDNLNVMTQPGDPAYVIYTSGSTGQPKGIVLPHGQILNRLAWMWQAYPFQADDVGVQKTSCNFVDSLWELFGYLLQGRPTVIVPDMAVREPRALVEQLSRHRVTQLWLVPSLLRLLLDTFSDLQVCLPALRFWVTSGEALPVELLRRFQAELPRATLYNLYGTSEVWDATWYDPNGEAQMPQRMAPTISGSVPIGRPIANVKTYILDPHLQAIPIGARGELYVSGAGLAERILNQPRLNAERFIANPYACGDRRFSRLYKTGDLARYLPDGNIELLGRVDLQVKVRGFRVEPGEIEAVLNQHEAVQQCAVVARRRGNGSGDLQLVAYVIRHVGAQVTQGELSVWLRHRLPTYMVPSVIVSFNALPLTPGGKIDRRALPAPELRSRDARELVAARDSLEMQLTSLWETVLGVRPIGVTDNFFDLGGHSLLAVQLFDRIAKLLGKDLPVSSLFEAPTIDELAALMRQGNWSPKWKSLVAVKPGGKEQCLFIAPPAGCSAVTLARLTGYLDADLAVYGLGYQGMDGKDAPHASVEEIASYHLREIRKLQPAGPYLLGGICFGSLVALEMGQQLHARGEQVALLAILDGQSPTAGPGWEEQRRTNFHYLRRMKEEWRRGRLTELLRGYQEATQYRLHRFRNRKYPTAIQQVVDAQIRARKNYHAHPYAGPLLLIQSQEYADAIASPRSKWEALARDKFEYVLIPNSTHEEVLMQEPGVQVLAAHLSRGLARAVPVRARRETTEHTEKRTECTESRRA
jgi:amino acid adenylation domain-containing protein